MNNLKYFTQFVFIYFLFLIFKILGLKNSSIISGKILLFLGPIFRSNKTSYKNLLKAFPNITQSKKNKLFKRCGLTMERYYQNMSSLKILDIQKNLLNT